MSSLGPNDQLLVLFLKLILAAPVTLISFTLFQRTIEALGLRGLSNQNGKTDSFHWIGQGIRSFSQNQFGEGDSGKSFYTVVAVIFHPHSHDISVTTKKKFILKFCLAGGVFFGSGIYTSRFLTEPSPRNELSLMYFYYCRIHFF